MMSCRRSLLETRSSPRRSAINVSTMNWDVYACCVCEGARVWGCEGLGRAWWISGSPDPRPSSSYARSRLLLWRPRRFRGRR